MPIYEYHCEECGADFERLLKRRDEKVSCECGSTRVVRRLSVFAAHMGSSSSSSASAGNAPACSACSLAGGSCAFEK